MTRNNAILRQGPNFSGLKPALQTPILNRLELHEIPMKSMREDHSDKPRAALKKPTLQVPTAEARVLNLAGPKTPRYKITQSVG
jgi:hypothetical protein